YGPNAGIPWKNLTRLQDLDFVDNVAFLLVTSASLQDMTTNLDNEARKYDYILVQIRPVMLIGSHPPNTLITIVCQPIEHVQQFTYLAPTIDKKTKLQLYKTIIVLTAIYASEACTAQKLCVYHQSCLQNILGVTWHDHVTNEEMLQLSGSRTLQELTLIPKKCCKMRAARGKAKYLRVPQEINEDSSHRVQGTIMAALLAVLLNGVIKINNQNPCHALVTSWKGKWLAGLSSDSPTSEGEQQLPLSLLEAAKAGTGCGKDVRVSELCSKES
ncbi:hypothetical protein L345_15974, partial [Ophiophagus hannah]